MFSFCKKRLIQLQKRDNICSFLLIMRHTFITLFLISFFSALGQDVALSKKDLGKITLEIPDGFYKMSENDVVEKYGMVRIPEAIYSSPTNDILISITVKEDTTNNAGLVEYKNKHYKQEYQRDLSIEKAFRKSSLRYDFDQIVFYTDTAYSTSKTKVIEFEFEGELVGEDAKGQEQISSVSYNYLYYGFVKKRTFVVNISAPISMKEDWQPIAQKIIASINIK